MSEVSTLEIPSQDGLDAITVYWHNYEPGRGMATIVCYDMAWTAWFGAMSGRTIQRFFNDADRGYLVNKFGYAQFIKVTKGHHQYLGRIIRAIKQAIA